MPNHSCYDIICLVINSVGHDGLKHFDIIKIKAHLPDDVASSDLELFTILGNQSADLSAKAVLTPECCRSVQLSLQLQDFYTQQLQALDNFLDFLVGMDRQRVDIVALKTKVNLPNRFQDLSLLLWMRIFALWILVNHLLSHLKHFNLGPFSWIELCGGLVWSNGR